MYGNTYFQGKKHIFSHCSHSSFVNIMKQYLNITNFENMYYILYLSAQGVIDFQIIDGTSRDYILIKYVEILRPVSTK